MTVRSNFNFRARFDAISDVTRIARRDFELGVCNPMTQASAAIDEAIQAAQRAFRERGLALPGDDRCAELEALLLDILLSANDEAASYIAIRGVTV